MANLKGSGKGGRKRIYGDLEEKERMKLSHEKFIEGKRKMNFFVLEKDYQRFIKLEEESGFKFHSEFLNELVDKYELMEELRKMILREEKKEQKD